MRNPFTGSIQFQKVDRGCLTQSEVETLVNFRSDKKKEDVSLKTFINIIDTFSLNISEEQFNILKEVWQQLNRFEKITVLYIYKDG